MDLKSLLLLQQSPDKPFSGHCSVIPSYKPLGGCWFRIDKVQAASSFANMLQYPLQLSHVSRPPSSLAHKWLPQKSHRDVSVCVLHLHDKRCSLGIHESLVMIVTSFTLRSPYSQKLQCEMYVLQFCFEPLQRCACATKVDVALPLHRRIYVYAPSPLFIYYLHTLTSADLPLHLTTPTHLRIYISHLRIHTVAPSHLSCLAFFLSFFLSFLHIFSLVSVHKHLRTLTSTDLPLHL